MSAQKNDLILAIDQGTTSTRALVVNPQLKILGSHSVEYRQIYPKPGWVEHNLDDIWASTIKAIKTAVRASKANPKRIMAIGITNQRETSCFWSRKTGKPLCNAIVWQDRRTADFCDQLKRDNNEPFVRERTGLLLDPYFSGSKVRWALQNNSKVKAASEAGDCAFGTIDTFLVHKLTAGAVHATEASNASRTLLFNIEKLDWDDDMLRMFDVPRNILPAVLDSTARFGETRKVPGLPDGIPIHGILGDQQSALLGQACIEEGTVKCTYGTGSFILMNTGSTIRRSTRGLLATVGWKIGGRTVYALEGGAFTAGASVQWLRDGLKIIKKSADVEKLARSVKTSDGVIFVPAFVGIGAPHWMPHARAAFFGITRGTNQGHIARAVLEGIALMNHDILRAMEADLGQPMRSLNVDGGACRNDLLMQFQADVLDRKLLRPKIIETTAVGAVFAAGLGGGIWSDLISVRNSWKCQKTFQPEMSSDDRALIVESWKKSIHSLK